MAGTNDSTSKSRAERRPRAQAPAKFFHPIPITCQLYRQHASDPRVRAGERGTSSGPTQRKHRPTPRFSEIQAKNTRADSIRRGRPPKTLAVLTSGISNSEGKKWWPRLAFAEFVAAHRWRNRRPRARPLVSGEKCVRLREKLRGLGSRSRTQPIQKTGLVVFRIRLGIILAAARRMRRRSSAHNMADEATNPALPNECPARSEGCLRGYIPF